MTLNDLLDLALRHEIKSQQMYLDWFSIVQDADARDFLLELVRQEKQHETALLQMINAHVFTGTEELENWELYKEIEESHSIVVEIGKDAHIGEVLELALQRERHAQALFHRLALSTQDSELRSIFESLERQEGDHSVQIMAMFDRSLRRMRTGS